MRRVKQELQCLRELIENFTTRGRSESAFSFRAFFRPYLLWEGNGREGSMPSSFAKRYARLSKVKVNTPWFSVATARPVVPGKSSRALRLRRNSSFPRATIRQRAPTRFGWCSPTGQRSSRTFPKTRL